MVNFIDKTSSQNGTPLNRANMMAVQGFEEKQCTAGTKYTFRETNDAGDILSVTIDETTGHIIEKLQGSGNARNITKTISYDEISSGSYAFAEVLE